MSTYRYLSFLGAIIIALVIISIFCLDLWAAHILSPEQAAKSYRITRTLTDAGESGHFFAIAILCSWGSWLILKTKVRFTKPIHIQLMKVKSWGTCFLYGLIASGITIHLIKFLTGRARPNQTPDHYPWIFEPLNTHWHFHSFPSGHSQTLFSAAVAFCFAFPKAKYPILLIATALATTRVLLNQHFLSDVLMGSYLGYAITFLIFTKNLNRSKDP